MLDDEIIVRASVAYAKHCISCLAGSSKARNLSLLRLVYCLILLIYFRALVLYARRKLFSWREGMIKILITSLT